MSALRPPAAPLAPFRVLAPLAPALAVAAAALAVGTLGALNPMSLAIVALVAGVGLTLAFARRPLLLLWLVPISMAVFVRTPVLHYEALVVLLAFMMLLAGPHGDIRLRRLEPVEWRYLVFLLSLLPGLFFAASLWRFGGALKLFTVGLLGFEVARQGTRRFGRTVMLWGPLAFIALTCVMTVLNVKGMGLHEVRSFQMRSVLAQLPWGSTNYVAAVIVLCMPAMFYAARESSGWRRAAVVGVLVSSLGVLLVTESRGGFVLSVVYLAAMGIRPRRSLWIAVAAGAAAVLVLGVSPLGRSMLSRFSVPNESASIWLRLFIWRTGWQRAVTHLPFGVGAGQGLIQNDALGAADPHDYLLTLFSETGLPGLAAWLWLIAGLVGAVRRLARNPETRQVAKTMGATLALAMTNMLFEPTLTGNLYHLLFWWLMGIYYGVPLVGAAARQAAGADPVRGGRDGSFGAPRASAAAGR